MRDTQAGAGEMTGTGTQLSKDGARLQLLVFRPNVLSISPQLSSSRFHFSN